MKASPPRSPHPLIQVFCHEGVVVEVGVAGWTGQAIGGSGWDGLDATGPRLSPGWYVAGMAGGGGEGSQKAAEPCM